MSSADDASTTDRRLADIIVRIKARLYDALVWTVGSQNAKSATTAARDFGQAHPFLQVRPGT